MAEAKKKPGRGSRDGKGDMSFFGAIKRKLSSREALPYPDTERERSGAAGVLSFVSGDLGAGKVAPTAWLVAAPIFPLLSILLARAFWIGLLGAGLPLLVSALVFLCLAAMSRPCAKDSLPARYVLAKKAMGYLLVASFIVDCVFMTSAYAALLLDDASYLVMFVAMALRALTGFALFVAISRKPLRRALGLLALRGKRERHETPFRRTFAFHALDTLDALLQAALIVIFVNAFFFQIYVIPSESMVPTYLVGDRTIVSRLGAGAKVPLTTVKLPGLKAPARGDIAVVQNPRYEHSAATAVGDFARNIVFMLTFSAVNPNATVPDPLVKRIIGVPGDRLCMVDDVVWYQRDGGEWKPMEEDEAWSATSPADFAGVRGRVLNYVVPEDKWKSIEEAMKAKAELDLDEAAAELAARAREILAIVSGSAARLAAMEHDESRAPFAPRPEAVGGFEAPGIYEGFVDRQDPGSSWAIAALARAAREPEYAERVRLWLVAWTNAPEADDPASRSVRRENVLLKLWASDYLVEVARSLAAGATPRDALDSASVSQARLTRLCSDYFDMLLWSKRNFPAFPGDGSIPEGKYFMMGDNRYNSIDCRHKGEGALRTVPLDRWDVWSPRIYSGFDPMYVDISDIMGYPALTVWPPNRFRFF